MARKKLKRGPDGRHQNPPAAQPRSAAAFMTAPWLPVAICAAFVLAGASVLLVMTSWGIGTTTDSTRYIAVARNFLNGYGLSLAPGNPLTHYPPLYPLALSVSGLFGQDPLDGARWLHAFFFGMTLALAGLMLYRETRRSAAAMAAGLLLLLTSGTLISVFSFAWSESLFIVFFLAGFLLLRSYLEKPSGGLLLGSACCIGCALLTRYAGSSLVIACCLCILLLSPVDRMKKCSACVLFGLVSFAPVGLWFIRNRLVAGSLANRSLEDHIITWQQAQAGMLTVSKWFFIPEAWSAGARTGAVVIIVLAVVAGCMLSFRIAVKKEQGRGMDCLPAMFLLFAGSYLLFLGFSISYIDAHTPLDDRILSPLYVFGSILLVYMAHRFLVYYGRNKAAAAALVAVLLCCSVVQVSRSAPLVASSFAEGRGFSSRYWKTSPIMGVIKALPDDMVVFTNGADAIEFLTGKSSQMIPSKIAPDTRVRNKDFAAQIQNMAAQLSAGTAVLAYFDGITWRWYLPSKKELEGMVRVPALYDSWDGVIFGVKK